MQLHNTISYQVCSELLVPSVCVISPGGRIECTDVCSLNAMCRFIPDDLKFDDREPKSVAKESMVMADYNPAE